MKKKVFFFMTGILFSILSMPVMASSESGTVSKTYRFTTEDEKETHDEKFDQQIVEEGKVYELRDINYKIISKEPIILEEKVEKIIETDYMPAGDTYVPESTITENGITYSMDSSIILPEESQLRVVTGYTDYSYPVSEANVPSTKEITIQTSTGEDVNVTCDLTSVHRLADGTWEDSYIDITFISYDAEIFEWQGLSVTADVNNPLKGYEAELLSSVGVDATTATVREIVWAGDPYYDASGVLCRNATANISRYVNYYRANYAGTYNETPGVKYRVVYSGTEQIESDTEFTYEMEAIAKYDPVEEKKPVVAYVMAGIGILLLVVLLVLVLYVIAKKKNEKEEGTINSTLEKQRKRRSGKW